MPDPGWGFRLLTMITLTTGTALIMWLGEQISEKGIGNGISLIIFAGIVVRLPSAIVSSFTLIRTGELKLFVFLGLLLMMLAVTAAVIVMQEGQRKIPVQYAKRVVGRRVYGGQSTHIPLRINTAGVIPVIFASSLILFPATLTRFISHPWMQVISESLSPGHITYTVLYCGLIIFFAYFYTAIVFNPIDLADNMKKYGGLHPRSAAGQEDGGVHRPDAHPHHAAGRGLPRPHLGAAGLPHPLVQHAVLLRRHQPPHRGRRGARHRAADGVAPAHAELRGLPPQEAAGARVSHAGHLSRALPARARARRRASSPREWGVPQVATGDMLREAVAAKDAARARGQALHGLRARWCRTRW